MIIVTGGAGCIGSAIIWALNKRGIKDIILVDGVDHPEKKRNIALLVSGSTNAGRLTIVPPIM